MPEPVLLKPRLLPGDHIAVFTRHRAPYSLVPTAALVEEAVVGEAIEEDILSLVELLRVYGPGGWDPTI